MSYIISETVLMAISKKIELVHNFRIVSEKHLSVEHYHYHKYDIYEIILSFS